MRDHMRTELPLAAFMMAAQRQDRPKASSVIPTAEAIRIGGVRQAAHCSESQPSMSRTACCYDNAPMESFFQTLKVELVHQQRWAIRECRRDLFAYVKATIIDGGSTPLLNIGPRNRPNDTWPKPVSTKTGDHQLRSRSAPIRPVEGQELHPRRQGQRPPGVLHAGAGRSTLQPRPQSQIPAAHRNRQTRQGRHHRRHAKARRHRKRTAQGRPPPASVTRLTITNT